MAKAPLRLGKLQLQIMRILWVRGRATAREITGGLNRGESVAHSTVQTLLRKLEAKGAIAHESEERTFVFRPLYQQSEVTESALHDLLTRLFNGSIYGLVSHLIQHERISQEELTRLRELIETEEE